MISNAPNALITKEIIHAGTKSVSFKPGTKVFFHYETRKCDGDFTLLDDSRKLGMPMELILGKKFKLEVWENIVQNMSLNEVAKFTVDKSLLSAYPFVSKTLREAKKPKEERQHHCCGITLQNEGIGYDDLNDIIKNPCNLQFIIELFKVEAPEEYEKESWQMNDEEKTVAIPKLKEEGNALYNDKNYDGAAKKYAQAIGLLEQLMINEKPGTEEWHDLNKQKLPFLLNFSQCKLNEKDYYAVIEHCTSVLSVDPDNVKALFRRAKAHVGAWNPDKAHADFQKAMQLEPSLTTVIKKEIKFLEELERQRNIEDQAKYKGKMF